MPSSPVSFGDAFPACIQNFKTALSNAKPRIGNCLMIAVPAALIYGLLLILIVGGSFAAGLGAAGNADDEETAVVAMVLSLIVGVGLFLIALSPFATYFGFCAFRFTSRASTNPSQTFTFGSLYAYESSLWGFVGLTIMQLLLLVPVSIVAGILGSILFFIPRNMGAFPVMFFWVAAYSCSVFAFFDSPNSGVGAAFSRGWSLALKDWKRWLALSIVMIGAFLALGVLNLALEITIGFIPFLGPVAIGLVAILVNFYVSFVLCSTYRDSVASVG